MKALCAALALLAARLTSAQAAHSLSSITNISCAGATCAVLAADDGGAVVPLRLTFFAPSVIRYWLALDGNFSDTGAAADVIVSAGSPVTVALRDAGDFYEVTQLGGAPGAALARLGKRPPLLSLVVNGTVVAREVAPLAWNATASWSTLARDDAPAASGLAAEHFFGAGMQNGRFAHRDTSVDIGVDYNWDEGGHGNSAPWYVSTAGVGVLRNTWAPGRYSFGAPVVAAHLEATRFDAFYLVTPPGPGALKALLGLYTELTGPPFLPPLYGLFLGDSDCCADEGAGAFERAGGRAV